LNAEAKKYGMTTNEAFNKKVTQAIKKDVSKNFNSTHWVYKAADEKS
jgi:hypothetical protein